jgi:hypothetical protein
LSNYLGLVNFSARVDRKRLFLDDVADGVGTMKGPYRGMQLLLALF